VNDFGLMPVDGELQFPFQILACLFQGISRSTL
jgi:hypothetical protein